jgi:hydrogenase maturation protease
MTRATPGSSAPPGVRPRVLVAGVGNIFLGDDGFGPAVAQRLVAGPVPDGVRVVDYGIRGRHLAYDLLEDWDLLVLVDAIPAQGEPGLVHVLEVGADDVPAATIDAHSMDPGAVLGGVATLGGALPRTVVVGCEAAHLEEGIGLTASVAAAVDRAAAEVWTVIDQVVPAQTGGR